MIVIDRDELSEAIKQYYIRWMFMLRLELNGIEGKRTLLRPHTLGEK